ncbi:MAG: hypothetical protein ACLR79_01920 [Waltera sp.]
MKNLCKQNWYQITLLFLFCVTVFLRFYKLTVLPDVLHIDEAALGYNSWCLANYGTDRYLNVLPFYPQNFYGGQSPLYLPCRIADQVFREGESVRFSGKISCCLCQSSSVDHRHQEHVPYL